MFYDRAKIHIKAGDGGAGVVAFRREKYVPMGGPSGGDGGGGGDVILQADEGLRTLVDFHYKNHYKAERGQHGEGKNCHGRGSEDIMLRLPPGTLVKNADTGELLADMREHGQRVIVARGGRGGRGNARFVSNNNKAPRIAERGEPGEEFWLDLELKLLADVGLVGMPNAGKSTLISAVSAARPKIADYPFTTMTPHLGVVKVEDDSFVMADIPGLIEGAHTGAGLGHEFLRHVERTRLLLHVIDMSGQEGRDPLEDYAKIRSELELYSPELAKRRTFVVANKMDVPEALEHWERFKNQWDESQDLFAVSAVTGLDIDVLLRRITQVLPELPQSVFLMDKNIKDKSPEDKSPEDKSDEVERDGGIHRVIKFQGDNKKEREKGKGRFMMKCVDGVYVLSGKEVERHAAMAYLESEQGVHRFQNILKRMGVDEALKRAGIKEGDPVMIGNVSLQWTEGGK